MNPLTLMLLTVLANAIVTGIIVYLIQKRIERSYTRQLEEFKANLQYSNFEQQTKFTKIHEKRVETLETLYQKFVIIAHDLRVILVEACQFERKRSIDYENVQNINLELDDFWKYFVNNRLFMPANAIDKINNVYVWSLRVLSNIHVLLHPPDKVSRLSVELTNYNIEAFDLDIDTLDLENPDFMSFANSIDHGISSQLEALEMLYKSVADTTGR